jgi:ribonucleoside-diphosphate reductase alpha chain
MKRDLKLLLPPQEITTDVLLEKYAKNTESTVADIQARVARALAQNDLHPDRWEAVFLKTLQDGFVPAGRISSAAGSGINATLINCFVQPVGDSVSEFVDGFPGIYTALAEAAETMRRGGGVGYCFSKIRPKGSMVGGTHSRASGPISFMRVFDKSCETVESAGSRRGAQMGILRCDHPDIYDFVVAKANGDLKNFNISIGVTDAFMIAVRDDTMFDLVHKAAPNPAQYPDFFRCDDGMFSYARVRARDLWAKVMRSTYDCAEPGIVFLDTINRDNNLHYVEKIEACNPCGEQSLPPYGACCLGSQNLTAFVNDPFTPAASFDYARFGESVRVATRMLDNVLDVTYWPLEQQRQESVNKRRVGQGFLGLGDALVMLGVRYDSDDGRKVAARISEALRDEAYRASVQLAKEKGSFPMFDAKKYLASGFASRLPKDIREDIRKHGIRNSHLVSIAPTGTITLAFADNASNGIEPAFSWTYDRKKRMPDESVKVFEVADHAYRLYRAMGGDTEKLPSQFVTALEMHCLDHMQMMAAVQPFVDSAISKTVNVPEDYPFDDFQGLYFAAWEAGLKGLATYRPNPTTGSVLSVKPTQTPMDHPAQPEQDDPDRRLRLDAVPDVSASLVYPSRPHFEDGNLAWTYMMEVPGVIDAGLFIGQSNAGVPFEAWVNGADQPRGLGAVAKLLSIDMRANDSAWLKFKLKALLKADDNRGFDAAFPGSTGQHFSGIVPYFSKLVSYRCEQQHAFDNIEGQPSPLMDSLLFRKEPKSRGAGTLSWTWDCNNVRSGDDFVVFLKEIEMPDGSVRPYSVWLSGVYPKALDGLCKLLSLDMWVQDPAWIGLKLRKLLNYSEAELDFMHWVPGNGKQAHYPSSIAYLAHVILYRYMVLGLLDTHGKAVRGGMASKATAAAPSHDAPLLVGKVCPECSNQTVIKLDGCERCTNCGFVGTCG